MTVAHWTDARDHFWPVVPRLVVDPAGGTPRQSVRDDVRVALLRLCHQPPARAVMVDGSWQSGVEEDSELMGVGVGYQPHETARIGA